MGATVYTGGTNPINATLTLTHLASGNTVTAWRQGISYPMSYVGVNYVATVPLYGTYTIRVAGQSAYKDAWVNSGSVSVIW